MAPHKEVKWGIMATGWIASKFVTDLLIDPQTRGVDDVSHTVVAVASSSRKQAAEDFIQKFVTTRNKGTCHAYGSYAEMLSSSDIDVVYIATPHSRHFECCMMCLDYGKPILCEKVFTMNADQARIVYEKARQKNLFVMENVWTRFLPISIAIREYITSGQLGEVVRVYADLSYGETPESWPSDHRSVNLDLAGGCLLDLGIYSLTWVFQCLYHTQSQKSLENRPKVHSLMSLYPATGVDETTTVILEFPSSPTGAYKAHAIATTSFRTDWDPDKKQTSGPSVRILGPKAELQVSGPASRPTKIKIIPQLRGATQAGMKAGGAQGAETGEVQELDFGEPGAKGNGRGMFWSADAVARSLQAGKIENETIPWDESILIMEVIDQVKKDGGLIYPAEIESTDYTVRRTLG